MMRVELMPMTARIVIHYSIRIVDHKIGLGRRSETRIHTASEVETTKEKCQPHSLTTTKYYGAENWNRCYYCARAHDEERKALLLR